MLVERNIDPDAPSVTAPARRWAVLLAAALFVGAILYCLAPHKPLTVLAAILLPLLLIWWIERLLK